MRARMSWATISRPTMSWATIVALLLAAISVVVTLSLIDYPLGVAWDEVVKLVGVTKGRYAYYHPLLMIDLAQGAALVVQPPDQPSLAHLVRVLGALAGGVMVFATFNLARLVLPDLPALAAAAASAVAPLFVVHARLFKEDIFVAAFLVLALAALIRLLQEPAPHRAILLGLLVGLAAGSKSDYQRNGRRILGLRMRPTKDTADIVVTANLAYDRFEFYAARKGTVQQTVRPITGSFSCGLILRCRMDGRPWPTSIRWCGLLPWTDRWRG
ncbi:glycosyltransferase family 39 protein [Methyloceanibacter sp.]|jgi:hypothetical protein|uniref:glycosyltransferase family 39 protein n=1 Tax=Methyloceanibacter sp. TaxID=1965321 RepID=UPI003C754F3A